MGWLVPTATAAVVEFMDDTREDIWEFKDWFLGLPWDWIFPILMILVPVLIQLFQSWRNQGTGGTLPDDFSSVGSQSDGDSEEEEESQKTKLHLQAMKDEISAELQKLRLAQEEQRQTKERTRGDMLEKQVESEKMRVRDLLHRVKIQEEIAKRDAFRKDFETDDGMVPGRLGLGAIDPSVGPLIEELKLSMVDGKEKALSQLENFDPHVQWKLPGQMTERVSHKLTAKVFRNHKSFLSFFHQWLKDRGLWKSSIASEIMVLARSMDAENQDGAGQALNRESFEVKARRLYGYTKAFELGKSEGDWKTPKGQAARGWVSKVQWPLLDAYDVLSLEGDGVGIESVDRETANILSKKRQLEQYVEALGKDGPAIGAQVRFLAAADDD